MHPMMKILRNLAWLTQLGLSIILPPILCVWGCDWLANRFSIGSWLVLLGLVLGLGTSLSSALRFYRVVRRQAEKSRKKPGNFNLHE